MGGLCGFVIGAIVAAGVVVGGAGIFWIFVFGDNPWPPAAETLLVAVGLVAWLATTVAGVRIGIARTPSPRRTIPS